MPKKKIPEEWKKAGKVLTDSLVHSEIPELLVKKVIRDSNYLNFLNLIESESEK